MREILPILVANSAIACALAMVALVAMWCRRPALAHVVWVLVIVKLVTPPVWRVEVISEAAAKAQATVGASAAPVVAPPRMVSMPHTIATERTEPPMPVAVLTPRNVEIDWFKVALAVCIAGAVAVLALAVARVRRCRRALRDCTSTDHQIAADVAELTVRIGLPRPPRVLLVDAPVSPMLWFLRGRAALVLPQQLMRTLDAQQRRAVIAHELAHLRRGDHWVRIFELLATAALWWHPLLWLARRGLHDAEEQCCDAWVVAVLPDSRRRYADALVDSMEFVSQCAMPAGASGLGRLHNLRRRLVMIVDRTPPKSLSLIGRICVLALLIALPIMPVRGDESAARDAEPVATTKVDDSTRRVVEALLETAQDPNDELRNESFAAITRMGSDVMPVLIEALQRENTATIAKQLVSNFAGAAIDPLIAALSSPSAATRRNVLEAMQAALYTAIHHGNGLFGGGGRGFGGYGAMGMEGAMPGGEAPARPPQYVALIERAVPAATKAAEDEDARVRRAAVLLLGLIAQYGTGDDVIKTLTSKFKDDDLEVRRAAAHAIAQIQLGDRASVATSALAEAVNDEDDAVKLAALTALAQIGPDAKGATDAVLTALKSTNADVRIAAARALGAMRQQPPPAEAPVIGVEGGEVMMGGPATRPARPPRPPGRGAPSGVMY